MNKNELKIVYMGTPDFAVEPLRRLVEGGYNVVGVVTMPDKPAGRGHKIQFSPVKQFALQHNLRLLQPARLKDEGFVEELRSLCADLQIVVAFRMLPEVVWNMPPLGTFNLHASLLPQYRGAAPINWAIINGDTETGVTTFFLTHEIDTGKIIQQEKIAISDTDTAETIHDALMYKGAELLLQTVDNIIAGKVTPKPQEELYVSADELRPAPKIFKDTCYVDFSQPAKKVYDLVRGLSPYPAAWCNLVSASGDMLAVKIYETAKIDDRSAKSPGSIETDGKSFIKVACGCGAVELRSILLPGKKRMGVAELLRGFHIDSSFSFVLKKDVVFGE